ncbi:hypothetical protein ACWAU3_19045 [Shewanella sp. JL219SE-S6]
MQGAQNQQQQALLTVIQGQALAISEPLALTLGLAPGDKLSLCPDKECKTPLTLPISAIYYDYGNPKGRSCWHNPSGKSLSCQLKPLAWL